MPNPIIKIVNVQTGEEIEREMTADEIKIQQEADKIQAKRDAEIAEANAPKVAAKAALLERLGLTEDELKTILG
jgi:antitoxin component of MazEF toxin-antitoxin module